MKRIIACLLLGGLALSAFGETVKVKFDGNGGRASAAVQSFDDGEEYCGLPSASRNGYLFAGWWTEKEGGTWVPDCDEFDASIFAGQKTPTLYAHWKAIVKLTLKDDSAHVDWDPWESYGQGVVDFLSRPDLEGGGRHDGKGTVELLEGTRVRVKVNATATDKNGKELSFQKWTLTPTSASLGTEFMASSSETDFNMPGVALTLQATYADENVCGRMTAIADVEDVYLRYDEVYGGDEYLDSATGTFEWSVDNGKTWYKAARYRHDYYGDYAMLKAGKYVVTWRSNDPSWKAPEKKTLVVVQAGRDVEVEADDFKFIPHVVAEALAKTGFEYAETSDGGTVTINPKDGRVTGKTATFTAKAAKGYAFQGWKLRRTREDDLNAISFMATSPTWKMAEDDVERLKDFILTADRRVHVVAGFRALEDYSADDIEFSRFESRDGRGYFVGTDAGGDLAVDVRGVVGCAMSYTLRCGSEAYPLVYKLDGKLPAGLKFDVRTGVLSGVPTKAGSAIVHITATDPAKNSKSLKVEIEVSPLPGWLVGDFRGMINDGSLDDDDMWVPGKFNGLLELAVTSAGKVSGKVITRVGTRSVSGNLEWRDPEAEDIAAGDEYGPDAEFIFWHTDAKDDSYCHVNFRSDGTIDGDVDSYYKNEDLFVGGEMNGMRQDRELLAKSNFIGKYYTFAFGFKTYSANGYYCDADYPDYDPDSPDYEDSVVQSGYGYLTLKTDMKGAAKIVGQLPDGEKVSMTALVLPVGRDGTAQPTIADISARIYLFASPSAYKKSDWFAMSLFVEPDGSAIVPYDQSAWTPALATSGADCSPECVEAMSAQVCGQGALYSEARTLEGHYWSVRCPFTFRMGYEFSYRSTYYDEDADEDVYGPVYEYAWPAVEDYTFDVPVMGTSKGGISIMQKGFAPWYDKASDTWVYWEDKNGNRNPDPSLLSISFAKATGIFTGKATAYFDYPFSDEDPIEHSSTTVTKHASATLPYAGVMVREVRGGALSLTGFGSAVHSYKHTEKDDNGKFKTSSEKITLPVTIAFPED